SSLRGASEEVRAVENPAFEQQRRVIGIRAVRSSGEGMQELEARSVGLHPEDGAQAESRGASVQSRPIEKSRAVANERALRVGAAVCPPGKAVKKPKPGSVGLKCKAGPFVEKPSAAGRAIQIADSVEKKRRIRADAVRRPAGER